LATRAARQIAAAKIGSEAEFRVTVSVGFKNIRGQND
jgi:hypothetical protein